MTKIELKAKDYIFEYNNKNLSTAYIQYNFKETVSIPSGVSTNYLILRLSAQCDKREYNLELSLNISKVELKKYRDKFVNINDKVRCINLYEPNMSRTPDLDIANVDDLYSNPGNVWIKKEDENSFYVKISLPEYKLFVLFRVGISII